MELDAIKLTKNLAPYSSTLLIAKENSFIASQNGFKCQTISFSNNFSLNIFFKVRTIIKENNIKNIIFFGASELRSLYFSFLGLDINLIIRHGTTKSRPKQDLFHKLIYSKVNYHVSICKHLENNVNYIIPFGKNTQSKLIYSSIDFTKTIKKNLQKISLLHVGRIANAKGQIDAIIACQILVDNNIDFELNLVGSIDKTYEEEFMRFYNKCLYKDKINLVGFTTQIEQYYQNADIFIFPSHGEGLSNAFLEALAHKLLCITYKNTSFPELKELGLYFKISKNKDISKLKSTLLETVENLQNEQKKIEKNITILKKIFSKEKEISSYLSLMV
jgi:glycosyltransferase involved in cell wall biosynthesis